jgi:hypothetical protein
MTSYYELPTDVIVHILSFTEPITLTASYFNSMRHRHRARNLARFGMEDSHMTTRLCAYFHKLRSHFKCDIRRVLMENTRHTTTKVR